MSSINQKTLEQALTWFVALQDEACDQTTRQRFQYWLAQQESHVVAYQQAEQLWGRLDGLKQANNVPGLSSARSARRRSMSSVSQFGVLLLLCGFLTATFWQESHLQPVEWSTAVGEQRRFELADGSQIQLNGASRVLTKLTWWRREVTVLNGEALFEVKHQLFPVFTVHVDALQIRDVGTRFDVRKLDQENQVSVLEGEVELKKTGMWTGERLIAGFSRRFDVKGRLQPATVVNPEQTLAWTQGHLAFDRTPLSEVVYELQRQHQVSFVFAQPSLANETISGNFDVGDLKPFLNALEKILPIRVQRQSKKIILSRAEH